MAILFSEIKKFNPYHGADGRFTTGAAATSFTIRTKDPKKRWMVADAKSKERSRVRTQSLHSIEDRIRNQDYESAAVVDKNGNTLFFKDGEQSQVMFTSEESARMRGNTLTHNHPLNGFLSAPDIGTFVGNDLSEIRASLRNGKTYSLSRGDSYQDSNGMAFFNEFVNRMNDADTRSESILDQKGYQEKVSTGEVSQAQANKEKTELVSEIMSEWMNREASKYNLIFRTEEGKAA